MKKQFGGDDEDDLAILGMTMIYLFVLVLVVMIIDDTKPENNSSEQLGQKCEFLPELQCNPKNTQLIGFGQMTKLTVSGKKIQPVITKPYHKDNITKIACGVDSIAVIADSKLYILGKRWNTDKIVEANGDLKHISDVTGELTLIITKKTEIKKDSDEFTNTNVTDVSYGEDHMAIISDGKLYTCGNGERGQLGRGTDVRYGNGNQNKKNANWYHPTIVPELSNVTAVSCGAHHTAVIADGKLYTFGEANHGALGHDYDNLNEKWTHEHVVYGRQIFVYKPLEVAFFESKKIPTNSRIQM